VHADAVSYKKTGMANASNRELVNTRFTKFISFLLLVKFEGWTYFLSLISGFFSGASHCTPPEWEIVISICPDTG
jgi:hypothetical protein